MPKKNRKAAGAALGVAGAGVVGAGIYLLLKKKEVSLFGRVTDVTETPLSEVLVTADGKTTKTDANGDYELALEELGKYHVLFKKDGYLPYETDVTIEEGERKELNATLNMLSAADLVIEVTLHVWDAEKPFICGSSHAANIEVNIRYGPDTVLRTEFFLDSIPAGAVVSKTWRTKKYFQMPPEPGTYKFTAKLSIEATGVLIGIYELDTIQVIAAEAEVDVWWDDTQPFLPLSTHTVHIKVANPTKQDWAYTITFYFNYLIMDTVFTPIDQFSKVLPYSTTIPADHEVEPYFDIMMPTLIAEQESVDCPVAVRVQGVGYDEVFDFAPVRVSRGPVPEAQATVTWDVMPPKFMPGSTHKATVTVTNTTDQKWGFTAALVIAGEEVARKDLGEVGPGEKKVWTLDVKVPTIPGTWNVDVIVTETDTGLRVAHIRTEPIVIIETAPPPPVGMLSAGDIVKVLEWARCGHFLTDTPDKLGIGCRPTSGGNPTGDPRISVGQQMQRECATEVVNSFYSNLPSWAEPLRIVLFPEPYTYWQYYRQDIVLQSMIYRGTPPPECALALPTYAIKCGTYWKEGEEAYEGCIRANWGDMGVAVYKFWVTLITNMKECCTRKAQDYWNSLPDATKMSMWIKPAYGECVNALRTMNQYYANQWAPISPEGLMTKIRGLWGGYADIIERAQWAIANLAKYPWVK